MKVVNRVIISIRSVSLKNKRFQTLPKMRRMRVLQFDISHRSLLADYAQSSFKNPGTRYTDSRIPGMRN